MQTRLSNAPSDSAKEKIEAIALGEDGAEVGVGTDPVRAREVRERTVCGKL
jgi:hypothetical protein